MGLIYDPSESNTLVTNFQANVASCEKILSDLKTGNTHLTEILSSNQLSGAAISAGQELFEQLIIPIVKKVDSAIQDVKEKLQNYVQYTADAGDEVLDEKILDSRLQELTTQKTLLLSHIQSYQTQSLLAEDSNLATTYTNYVNKLMIYTNSVQQNISNVEDKIEKLHTLDSKTASLFSDSLDDLEKISTTITVLSTGQFNSNGKFALGQNIQNALFKFLEDYGPGAVKDSFFEGLKNFLEKMDTSMPNVGNYMHVYTSGNKYWKNIHANWDSAGYGKAFSNSLLRKGIKNLTVKKFGIGKFKVTGLGALGFGIDYLQNRNDGESVGTAVTHAAATSAIAGAGMLAVEAGSAAIASSLTASAGVVTSALALSPVGLAVGAGVLIGGLTNLAYKNNFLGFKDGVKKVGKAIDSGINSVKSFFGWGKKRHA